MKSYWLGALLVAAIGAATVAVVATRKPRVELVTPDPSVVAPLAREAQPQEAEPGLKNAPPIPVPHKKRVVAPPPKLDTIDPWTDRDLAPDVAAIAALEPHFEIDRADPWNARKLDPARPALAPNLDESDPWAANAAARPQEVAKVHVEKKKLPSDDPWAM